ncbi:hypothetical protein E2320_003008, partial [Naja naja]
MVILIILLLLPYMSCKPQIITCRIQATIPMVHKYFQAGDLIIGGITSFIFINKVFLYGPPPSINGKTDIPIYYHMVPGEDLNFRGILQLLVHFRWTWVGIFVKGEIGAKFEQLIFSWFPLHGICIAFLEQKLGAIYISNMDDGLKWFVEIFHHFINSKATVIIINDKYTLPISVCTESCSPGNFKRKQKAKPFCCYDCHPCPKEKISSQKDMDDCSKCPDGQYANKNQDSCLPKRISFLSFEEPMGICLFLYGPPPSINGKTDIPIYYHMVPGEDLNFRGILQLLVHFRWTWVGIFVKGEIGAKFEQLIFSWFPLHGICIAFLEQKLRAIYISNMDDGLKWFVEIFQRFINSKATVIIINDKYVLNL